MSLTAADPKAVLAGRDQFVFDLDNTLYPAHLSVFDDIGVRMTQFIARTLGCNTAEAERIRDRYHEIYGGTVVGLMRHDGIDPTAFMNDVHDVALGDIRPAPALASAIDSLPGRSVVFTNGASAYAKRVLARLGLEGVFSQVVALDDVGFLPKPEPDSFHRMLDLVGFSAPRCVMFEDSVRNLLTAKQLGMATVLVSFEGPAGPMFGHVDAHTTDLAGWLGTAVDPEAKLRHRAGA